MAITIPNSFTAGTTILSSQVNENFDELAEKALDKTGDTISGNITVNNGVTIDGVDISDALSQALKTTSSPTFANLTISGDASVGDDLTVTGDASVGANATVGGDLSVTGTLTIGGGGTVLVQEVEDESYNDNSSHASTATVNDAAGLILINDGSGAAGGSWIPFWANRGGAGTYAWSAIHPTGGLVSSTQPNLNFGAVGGNTYTVTFSGANGTVAVQRTVGSAAYRFRIMVFSVPA
jgi:hypothetical protein